MRRWSLQEDRMKRKDMFCLMGQARQDKVHESLTCYPTIWSLHLQAVRITISRWAQAALSGGSLETSNAALKGLRSVFTKHPHFFKLYTFMVGHAGFTWSWGPEEARSHRVESLRKAPHICSVLIYTAWQSHDLIPFPIHHNKCASVPVLSQLCWHEGTKQLINTLR